MLVGTGMLPRFRRKGTCFAHKRAVDINLVNVVNFSHEYYHGLVCGISLVNKRFAVPGIAVVIPVTLIFPFCRNKEIIPLAVIIVSLLSCRVIAGFEFPL